jgi:hypothetical protein
MVLGRVMMDVVGDSMLAHVATILARVSYTRHMLIP